MKLREYEYMLAIAREENMTKAAQTLYVSQSALSKLLSRLFFSKRLKNCPDKRPVRA